MFLGAGRDCNSNHFAAGSSVAQSEGQVVAVAIETREAAMPTKSGLNSHHTLACKDTAARVLHCHTITKSVTVNDRLEHLRGFRRRRLGVEMWYIISPKRTTAHSLHAFLALPRAWGPSTCACSPAFHADTVCLPTTAATIYVHCTAVL